MYTTTLDGWKQPTAHIAVNRNRLKHYGDKTYLKDKTHFEIELFNPKTTKVLAKIYLNDQLISSAGLVIKPGQRVFLERWLDEAKKFLFETYQVEDSVEAKTAIEKNGIVRVEFYDEIAPPIVSNYGPITYTPSSYLTDPWNNYTPSFGGTTVNTIYNVCSSSVGANASSHGTPVAGSLETGRAERGETSGQQFGSDTSSYSVLISTVVKLQILPESHKPVEVQNIRNYCHNCGSRMKNQKWKFCPNCGTKC